MEVPSWGGGSPSLGPSTPGGHRMCFPKRRAPRGGQPCSLLHPANLSLSPLLSLPHRARKGCRKEKRTQSLQPEPAEQAHGVPGPATPRTVVSGCGARSASPSCLRLHLLGSHHALSVSHCVRTFLSHLPRLPDPLHDSRSDPSRAAETPGATASRVSPAGTVCRTPSAPCLPRSALGPGRGWGVGGAAVKQPGRGPCPLGAPGDVQGALPIPCGSSQPASNCTLSVFQ